MLAVSQIWDIQATLDSNTTGALNDLVGTMGFFVILAVVVLVVGLVVGAVAHFLRSG